jgi:hypothetical protein
MGGRVWLVIVPEGDTVQYLEAPGIDAPVAADLELFKRSTVAEMANLAPLGAPAFGIPIYDAARAVL